MLVKLHTGTAALNAITNWPESVITAQPLAAGKKKPSLGDTPQFFNLKWNITSKTEPSEGWFKFENARMHRGIVSKEKAEGSELKFEGMRLSLRLKASQLGDFGKFLMLAEPEWQKLVERLNKEGRIAYNHKQDVHPIVYLTFTDKHKVEELRGKPNPDPTIKIKLDFGKYSDSYAPPPMVKGTQKTQIFDATKPYTDKDGKVKHKVATVLNEDGKEEELNANNVHKMLTTGSMVSGLIHIPAGIVSASWVSTPMYVARLYVAPGSDEGFDDEIAVPGAPSNDVKKAEVDDVDAFLNGMV
jgi:hypothetical protein